MKHGETMTDHGQREAYRAKDDYWERAGASRGSLVSRKRKQRRRRKSSIQKWN